MKGERIGAVRRDGLRVGVSLFIRRGPQSLWENGIFQNCLFLVTLLRCVPSIAEIYLVVGGDGDCDDAKRFIDDPPAPFIDMNYAASHLDLMIEMSAQLDVTWVTRFRERDGKVVSMHVGNDYVIDSERMIFNRPHGLLVTGAPYHEIWTLPQYERTCVPYYRSAMRAPVRVMPHLWSPEVLDRAVSRRHGGRPYGYVAGRKRWRAGIFEPNICMVKTCPLPMLCCESAHRIDPAALEHVWVYNALHLKEHVGFGDFARSLDLFGHGLVSFEGRFPVYEVLGEHVDVVVSHQWENAQNYLYYEALYGGYPLVHNSTLLGDCGYRYDGFDCEGGGRALLTAIACHDAMLDGYRETADAFLKTLHPTDERNVECFAQAIGALFEEGVTT